jgi:acyl-CoA synthetase (AMP-forming)/AMP-acid ligase II
LHADTLIVLLSSEDGSETYSVSTLKETALRFGHGIADQLGFKRSEVLLLVCANSIHVVPAILGTLHAGGIVSPVNPAYGVDELLYQLRDSGATVIVTQQPFLPAVLGAAQRAGIAQENIILLPDFLQPVSLFSPIGKITMFSDVVSTSTVQDTKGCVDATNDTAFLVYTSGTSVET